MTQDQFITTYTGKFVQFENDVIDKGQCLPLVQVFMQQVQSISSPPVTPSAKNYWLEFASLGLGQWYTQIPIGQEQSGDLCVYGPHGEFTDGHIAISVGNRQVFEQNADPDGSPAHVATRATTYLLGSLRLKENSMGEQPPNSGDVTNAKKFSTGVPTYQSPPAEVASFQTATGWHDLLYDTITGGTVQVQLAGQKSTTKASALAYVEANLQ